MNKLPYNITKNRTAPMITYPTPAPIKKQELRLFMSNIQKQERTHSEYLCSNPFRDVTPFSHIYLQKLMEIPYWTLGNFNLYDFYFYSADNLTPKYLSWIQNELSLDNMSVFTENIKCKLNILGESVWGCILEFLDVGSLMSVGMCSSFIFAVVKAWMMANFIIDYRKFPPPYLSYSRNLVRIWDPQTMTTYKELSLFLHYCIYHHLSAPIPTIFTQVSKFYQEFLGSNQFMKQFPNPMEIIPIFLNLKPSEGKSSPIIKACEMNANEILTIFLNKDIRIRRDMENKDGLSSLEIGIVNKNAKLVGMLMDNIGGLNEWTANQDEKIIVNNYIKLMEHFTFTNHYDTFHKFLRYLPKHLTEEESYLKEAFDKIFIKSCERGAHHIGEYILTKYNSKIDINKLSEDNKTPLIYTCINGNNILFNILINCLNLQFNQATHKGKTALYYACREGNEIFVSKLLAMKGINMKKSTYKEETVLHAALKSKSLPVLQKLCPRLPYTIYKHMNTAGLMPTHIAKRCKKEGIKEIVWEHFNKLDEDRYVRKKKRKAGEDTPDELLKLKRSLYMKKNPKQEYKYPYDINNLWKSIPNTSRRKRRQSMMQPKRPNIMKQSEVDYIVYRYTIKNFMAIRKIDPEYKSDNIFEREITSDADVNAISACNMPHLLKDSKCNLWRICLLWIMHRQLVKRELVLVANKNIYKERRSRCSLLYQAISVTTPPRPILISPFHKILDNSSIKLKVSTQINGNVGNISSERSTKSEENINIIESEENKNINIIESLNAKLTKMNEVISFYEIHSDNYHAKRKYEAIKYKLRNIVSLTNTLLQIYQEDKFTFDFIYTIIKPKFEELSEDKNLLVEPNILDIVRRKCPGIEIMESIESQPKKVATLKPRVSIAFIETATYERLMGHRDHQQTLHLPGIKRKNCLSVSPPKSKIVNKFVAKRTLSTNRALNSPREKSPQRIPRKSMYVEQNKSNSKINKLHSLKSINGGKNSSKIKEGTKMGTLNVLREDSKELTENSLHVIDTIDSKEESVSHAPSECSIVSDTDIDIQSPSPHTKDLSPPESFFKPNQEFTFSKFIADHPNPLTQQALSQHNLEQVGEGSNKNNEQQKVCFKQNSGHQKSQFLKEVMSNTTILENISDDSSQIDVDTKLQDNINTYNTKEQENYQANPEENGENGISDIENLDEENENIAIIQEEGAGGDKESDKESDKCSSDRNKRDDNNTVNEMEISAQNVIDNIDKDINIPSLKVSEDEIHVTLSKSQIENILNKQEDRNEKKNITNIIPRSPKKSHKHKTKHHSNSNIYSTQEANQQGTINLPKFDDKMRKDMNFEDQLDSLTSDLEKSLGEFPDFNYTKKSVKFRSIKAKVQTRWKPPLHPKLKEEANNISTFKPIFSMKKNSSARSFHQMSVINPSNSFRVERKNRSEEKISMTGSNLNKSDIKQRKIRAENREKLHNYINFPEEIENNKYDTVEQDDISMQAHSDLEISRERIPKNLPKTYIKHKLMKEKLEKLTNEEIQNIKKRAYKSAINSPEYMSVSQSPELGNIYTTTQDNSLLLSQYTNEKSKTKINCSLPIIRSPLSKRSTPFANYQIRKITQNDQISRKGESLSPDNNYSYFLPRNGFIKVGSIEERKYKTKIRENNNNNINPHKIQKAKFREYLKRINPPFKEDLLQIEKDFAINMNLEGRNASKCLLNRDLCLTEENSISELINEKSIENNSYELGSDIIGNMNKYLISDNSLSHIKHSYSEKQLPRMLIKQKVRSTKIDASSYIENTGEYKDISKITNKNSLLETSKLNRPLKKYSIKHIDPSFKIRKYLQKHNYLNYDDQQQRFTLKLSTLFREDEGKKQKIKEHVKDKLFRENKFKKHLLNIYDTE